MADVSASSVTILRSWTEGGVSGKEISCRQVEIDLSSQGGGTNKIPASVLFLSSILSSSNAVENDDSHIYPTAPSADGLSLLILDLSAVAVSGDPETLDAAAPGDITATVIVTVKGQA